MRLTRELLNERFNYIPDTGELIYKTGESAGRVIKQHNGKLYRRVGLLGKEYLVHRVIWFMHFGEWPGQLDHRDGNGMNNRIDNLRPASVMQNARNRRRYSSNKSGLSGVSTKPNGKWKATIGSSRSNGHHLGYFSTLFEAACARKSAELRLGFHPNHGQERPL